MRSWALCWALGALLALGSQRAAAYYLPGTYPREFRQGDIIHAEANSLVSSETEMPFDYYRLPFCKPPEGIKKATGTINPGTVLLGIRIYNSPYNFSIMEKTEGQYVCKGEAYPDHAYPPLSDREEKRLKDRIFQQYRVRLILDNLPITTYDLELDNESVLPGYELGYHKGSKFYVNNHLMFKILVHESNGQYGGPQSANDEKGEAGNKARKARKLQQAAAGLVPGEKLYMIVGFEVIACSVKREAGKPQRSVPCTQSPDDPNAPPAQLVAKGEKITYTYDVYWGTSDITWASRWDAYLRMPGGKVHWFSILNSLMVVVVMSCIVAMIMMRTIRRDLQRYEQLLVDSSTSAAVDEEESGWKLVSGDVFRAPANPTSL